MQSQNLSQIFRDMKNINGQMRENSADARRHQNNIEGRSDEEIIQDAINSITTHMPSPNDAFFPGSVNNNSSSAG